MVDYLDQSHPLAQNGGDVAGNFVFVCGSPDAIPAVDPGFQVGQSRRDRLQFLLKVLNGGFERVQFVCGIVESSYCGWDLYGQFAGIGSDGIKLVLPGVQVVDQGLDAPVGVGDGLRDGFVVDAIEVYQLSELVGTDLELAVYYEF